jgi:hypothetical protein
MACAQYYECHLYTLPTSTTWTRIKMNPFAEPRTRSRWVDNRKAVHQEQIQQKKSEGTGCWWPTPVILPSWEAEIGIIEVWGQPGQIVRLHLQNNHSKMNWRCDSSGRAPAYQMWSPEFNLQIHQNEKKMKNPKAVRCTTVSVFLSCLCFCLFIISFIQTHFPQACKCDRWLSPGQWLHQLCH